MKSNRPNSRSARSSLTSAFQPQKGAGSSHPPLSSASSKSTSKRRTAQTDTETSKEESLRKPTKAELNSITIAAAAASTSASSKRNLINPANSNSSPNLNLHTNPSNHDRPSTPPFSLPLRAPSSSSPSLLGSPPTLDLFEPTKRSPISVREDPDAGKLYLKFQNSKLKAAIEGPTRTISIRSQKKREEKRKLDAGVEDVGRSQIQREREEPTLSSSPRKRKLDRSDDDDDDYNQDSTSNLNSSPSRERVAKKLNFSSSPASISTSNFSSSSSSSSLIYPTTTPTNNFPLGLGLSYSNQSSSETGEEVEEEDCVLRPGQNKGKRVSLGSPKGLDDPNLKSNAKAKAKLVNQQISNFKSIPFGSSPPTKTSEKLRLRKLRREDEMDLGMGSEIEDDESQSQDQNLKNDRAVDKRALREESEELIITPRDVRERPTGLGVSPASYATPSKPSSFKASARSSLSSPLTKFKPQCSTQELSSNPIFNGEVSSSPINQQSSSIQLPALNVSLSSSLPLPPHYSSILTLHNALEHSLVVHLATAGTGSASIDSSTLSEENDDREERHISIPNLITYTNLRPIVENSCGRRLGVNEFSRLVGIWKDDFNENENKHKNDEKKEKEEIRGLGFIVNRTKTLDKTGKKIWDWGIGIELKMKLPPKRPTTPPIQVSFGGNLMTVPNTPPSRNNSAHNSPNLTSDGFLSSPPSKSSKTSSINGNGREGMSIIALWHNGIEFRKNEVARRLNDRCGRFHQAWLESKKEDPIMKAGLSTPSKKGKEREVLVGEGGLLTPALTRENGRRKGARVVHFDLEKSLESDDDDEEGDLTLMPSSELEFDFRSIRFKSPEPSSTPRSLRKKKSLEDEEEIQEWHPEFNLNLVSPLPLANLPSLKDIPKSNPFTNGGGGIGSLSKSIADQMSQLRQNRSNPSSSSSSNSETPTTPSSSGKLSLAERIKAKEDARKSELQKNSSSKICAKELEIETQNSLMKGYKRRSILSRLSEVADAIYMLFTTKSSIVPINDSSSPSSKRHSPTISIVELLNSITKSSKVSLSKVEAREALDLLIEISPGFLELFKVGDREWVKLGERKPSSFNNSSGEKNGIGLRECKARIARELVAPGLGRN